MPVFGGGDPLSVGTSLSSAGVLDPSIAEDVSDIIYQITPEDTPVYNSIGEGRVQSSWHLWQTRSIAGRARNANFEGFTYAFTGAMVYPDARRFNATQIFNKNIRVSETEVATRHYAIDDAFADQMSIGMTEGKMDAEHTVIQGTLVSGATNLARQMQGLLQALISGITTYTNVTAAASMSETIFNDYLQTSWNYGGEPRDVYCGGYIKRKISGFTGGATKFVATPDEKIVNTVSVYQSDFFNVQVHLSRDIPRQGTPSGYTGYGILFLDKTMAKKMWLRPWVAERAPKTADAYDGVVKCEFTLEWGNALAHHYAAQHL